MDTSRWEKYGTVAFSRLTSGDKRCGTWYNYTLLDRSMWYSGDEAGMMANHVVLETNIPGVPVRRGKVRDVYDLGDSILLVSTDRISAFDWILPNGIPDKGKVLTQLSVFWFSQVPGPNHILTTDVDQMPFPAGTDLEQFRHRTYHVKKTRVVPIECVVRAYLAGSGWKEYQKSQTVCGVAIPPGLVESSKLPEPIFTPSTKAEEGHDENISFAKMVELVGERVATELRDRSIATFEAGAKRAIESGIIIADTKFEWGMLEDGSIILIDEVMTPDSSRFWPADQYQPGRSQPSYDKQFVRDWLELTSGWDKNSPPPELPAEIIAKTREKYVEAYERITSKKFDF